MRTCADGGRCLFLHTSESGLMEGLSAAEAMRLGTLPIVAPTGGLKDTVEAGPCPREKACHGHTRGLEVFTQSQFCTWSLALRHGPSWSPHDKGAPLTEGSPKNQKVTLI